MFIISYKNAPNFPCSLMKFKSLLCVNIILCGKNNFRFHFYPNYFFHSLCFTLVDSRSLCRSLQFRSLRWWRCYRQRGTAKTKRRPRKWKRGRRTLTSSNRNSLRPASSKWPRTSPTFHRHLCTLRDYRLSTF